MKRMGMIVNSQNIRVKIKELRTITVKLLKKAKLMRLREEKNHHLIEGMLKLLGKKKLLKLQPKKDLRL
jgi:hypothetical protein